MLAENQRYYNTYYLCRYLVYIPSICLLMRAKKGQCMQPNVNPTATNPGVPRTPTFGLVLPPLFCAETLSWFQWLVWLDRPYISKYWQYSPLLEFGSWWYRKKEGFGRMWGHSFLYIIVFQWPKDLLVERRYYLYNATLGPRV